MRKILSLICVLILCLATVAIGEGEAQVGNWEDGDFFGGLKFYATAQEVEQAGLLEDDFSENIFSSIIVASEKPFIIDGYGYTLKYAWISSPDVYISLNGEATEKNAALAQFSKMEDILFEKWGYFTDEWWVEGTEVVGEFDYMTRLGNKELFSYKKKWDVADNTAILSIENADDGTICIVMIFTGPPYIDESRTAYFRDTTWGMTEDEVKASEPDKVFVPEGSSLVIEDVKVAGTYNAAAVFSFDSNGLLDSGGYVFTHTHTNDNDFINDYEKLKSQLVSLYGKPYSDDINWKNDLYKDDPQYHGFAISLGHLTYQSRFYVGRTEIVLSLSGDNYKHSFLLLYMDRVREVSVPDNSGL